jgi:hypothetical protein
LNAIFLGHGRIVNLFQGTSPNVPLLRMFNFTKEHYKTVFHYPVDRLFQMVFSNKPQLQNDTNSTNATENLDHPNVLQNSLVIVPTMESPREREASTDKNIEEKDTIEDQPVGTNDRGNVFLHRRICSRISIKYAHLFH